MILHPIASKMFSRVLLICSLAFAASAYQYYPYYQGQAGGQYGYPAQYASSQIIKSVLGYPSYQGYNYAAPYYGTPAAQGAEYEGGEYQPGSSYLGFAKYLQQYYGYQGQYQNTPYPSYYGSYAPYQTSYAYQGQYPASYGYQGYQGPYASSYGYQGPYASSYGYQGYQGPYASSYGYQGYQGPYPSYYQGAYPGYQAPYYQGGSYSYNPLLSKILGYNYQQYAPEYAA